jgi:phytoene dehydrogenase-like protein
LVKGDAGSDGLTGTWDEREREAMADRLEEQVQRHAPGFRRGVRARRILAPHTLQEANSNLHGGAINGGTTNLHQQFVFRPVPGTGRPETPVSGLYLASASAHPGGGVHGAPGANAARAALRAHGPARLLSTAQRIVTHRGRSGETAGR